MSQALPPTPYDVWLRDQQDLIDAGEDPLDQLLTDQAEEDARRDRRHDYTPNPIRRPA